MKHILVSNDDGYSAKGIEALALALSQYAKVTVIAPETNCSASSNSLTLTRPLYVKKASNGFLYVNGTPSDCVHVALTGILKEKPDLVVSGINNGANLGDDTLYSGTVAAATEGYLFGIPAIAFSLVERNWPNIEAAAQVCAEIVKHYLDNPLPLASLLSFNLPVKETYSMADIRVVRLGKRHPSQPVIEAKDPNGDSVYWIGPLGDVSDGSEDTDFGVTANGYISLTPLRLDLTHYDQLAPVSAGLEHICKTNL